MIERLITYCLEQRVIPLLLIVAICTVGAYSVMTIPADSFPDVSNVQVQIITEPESMATEEVESLITMPIEHALNGLPKIVKTRSNSSFGLSVVTAIFDDDCDVYFARNLVQQRLANISLPAEAPRPQLGPVVSSFSLVYMYLVQSDRHDLIDLRTLQDWNIGKRLLSVPGVGNVVSYGGFVKQYQVLVDPSRLRGYGLKLLDVYSAIANNNRNAGGNFIEQAGEEIIIRGLGRIENEMDIDDIVLKSVGGIPVKVANVAAVSIGPAFRRGSASCNGQGECITGLVMTRKGSNTKEVVERVEARIKDIERTLPDGVRIVPYYNQKELVDKTGETVREILFFSGGLVIVILAAILMDISAALIAAVIIPLALLFSFIAMKYTGLSANLMTLGAVDFGVIVDAGVVMVENIFRKLSHAREHTRTFDPLAEVISAAREVGKPIFFAIFIIVAVYLPLFTLEGVEGKMFTPLAMTFIYAILGALFIALTIIPVMCYWFMKKGVSEKHNPALEWINKKYSEALDRTMAIPYVVLGISFVFLVGAGCLIPFLGSEFMPSLDEGPIVLRSKLPASVSHTESRKVATVIENILKKFPEVTVVVSRIGRSGMGSDLEGVDNADVYIGLTPKDTWKDKDKDHLVDRLAAEIKQIPGLMYSFSQPIADMIDDLISGIKADVGIKIFGDDLTVINNLARDVELAVAKVQGSADVSREHLLGLPQLKIKLNRDMLARYGLNVSDVQMVIQTALAGDVVSEVIEGNKRFGILLRYPIENRDSEEDIRNLMIATASGAVVPLKQVADITAERGTVMVNREDGQRRSAVMVNIRGRDMGGWVADAQRSVAEKVKLPRGYWIVWGGQFENQQRAMARLSIVVPVVLALIFLLLYFSFNSVRNAGMIM